MSYHAKDNTETLILITKGRKTALPHIVRLRFAARDGSVYLIAASKNSDWVKNSISAGYVRFKVGQQVYEAFAEEGDLNYALELFREKYGRTVISTWYKDSESCIRLRIARRLATITGENQVSLTLADWKSSGYNYYDSVSNAFDSASEEYDFTISQNWINRMVRKRSLAVLLKYVDNRSSLLEIGCGTGEEAIKIAPQVKRIIATDISTKMIELVKLKIKAKNLEDKILPLHIPASRISEVEYLLSGNKLDLAYSFNGALNCEPDLEGFASSLSKLIKPSGYLICSIRNSVCASEMLAHLVAMQFDKCTPRKKQPIMVSVGGKDIPAFYYTPNEFARFFKPWFSLHKLIALPAIIPPAYLNEYFLKFGMLVNILERLDALFAVAPLFNLLGDQTLFVFQKKG